MTSGQNANTMVATHNYVLTSDLAKLSLPQTFRDANKKVAWVDSICLLFVIIGLIGLKQQPIIQKQLSEVAEVVPVIFTPPEEQPDTQPQPKPDDAEPPPQDQITDQPVIATVAVPNSPAVAFAVPVKGPVMVASEVRFASAPPVQQRQQVAPPKPTTFNPRAATGGRYPDPPYPRVELLARHEGKIMLYVIVDPAGRPSSVTVRDSSGWPTLDRTAADWVKNNWQWVPGEIRYYLVPIIYQIR